METICWSIVNITTKLSNYFRYGSQPGHNAQHHDQDERHAGMVGGRRTHYRSAEVLNHQLDARNYSQRFLIIITHFTLKNLLHFIFNLLNFRISMTPNLCRRAPMLSGGNNVGFVDISELPTRPKSAFSNHSSSNYRDYSK